MHMWLMPAGTPLRTGQGGVAEVMMALRPGLRRKTQEGGGEEPPGTGLGPVPAGAQRPPARQAWDRQAN